VDTRRKGGILVKDKAYIGNIKIDFIGIRWDGVYVIYPAEDGGKQQIVVRAKNLRVSKMQELLFG
jgi:hypothetical protein